MSTWNVKTEVFEGPLDLLLSLIEKRKLFINDISLSKVTDDYVSYIHDAEHGTLGERTHFILIASTLLLIKSKSLLPTLTLTDEEEHSIEDLERRLKEFKRIKELSLHVKKLFGAQILFSKTPQKNIEPMFSPGKKISGASMYAVLQDILKNIPKIEMLPKAIVQKVMSLEEMIERLTDRVKQNLKMNFSDFSGKRNSISKEEKVTIIVSFLAMLELVKQGIIHVHQEHRASDINMETNEVTLPSYG